MKLGESGSGIRGDKKKKERRAVRTMDDEEAGCVNISGIIHASQSPTDQTYLCLRPLTPHPTSSLLPPLHL